MPPAEPVRTWPPRLDGGLQGVEGCEVQRRAEAEPPDCRPGATPHAPGTTKLVCVSLRGSREAVSGLLVSHQCSM